MKKSVLVLLTLFGLVLCSLNPAESAVHVKKIKKKISTGNGETTAYIKPPKYLVPGIYANNANTWGTGRDFCYRKVLNRLAGYQMGEDLFMAGSSLDPKNPTGFKNHDMESVFEDMKQLDKDLEYIMGRVPPEVAAKGGNQTYRDLGIKPDVITHSKGAVIAELYSKNTKENGLIPTNFKKEYWDFARNDYVAREFNDIPEYKNNIGHIVELGGPVKGSSAAEAFGGIVALAQIKGRIKELEREFSKRYGFEFDLSKGTQQHDGVQDLVPESTTISGGKVTVEEMQDGKKVIKLEIVKGLQDREPRSDIIITRFYEDRLNNGDGVVMASETTGGDQGENGKNVKRVRVSATTPVKHGDLTTDIRTKRDVLKELGILTPEELLKLLANPDDNEDVSSAKYLPQRDLSERILELAKGKKLEWLFKYDEYSKLLFGSTQGKSGQQRMMEDQRRCQLKRDLDWGREQVWREFEEAPDVAVLENGHFEDAQYLVEGVDEPSFVFPVDFDPLIYEHKKVLIIPSGALQGYEGSKFFKARLDEFTKQGGVLICFTQPYGYNFQALPPMDSTPHPDPPPQGGRVIEGYGYQQDQNCYYKGSYLDQVHPILKNQQDGQIDVYADGYFTSWPQQAITPIRRAKNDAPCVVIYPYGKGWVCATTLYLDWGYTHQQFSEDERQLIKDLIGWAKDPNKPLTQEEKAKLKFAPRQSEEAQMFITSDQEEYAYGAPALFRVHIANKTEQEKTYRLYWAFPLNRAAREGNPEFGKLLRRDPLPPTSDAWVDVKVSAQGTIEHVISVPTVVVSPETLWALLYDSQGKYVATASRTFWLVQTGISVQVRLPADPSSLRGSIPVRVYCQNVTKAGFGEIDVKLAMIDPTGHKAFEETQQTGLDAGEAKEVLFNIPRSGKRGFYSFVAEIWHSGEKIGIGTGYAQLAEPIFDIKPVIKAATDQKVEAQFEIKNLGAVTEAKGTLRIALLDPAGAVIKGQETSLETDAKMEFMVPFIAEGIGPLKIGEYKLVHTLTWGDRKVEATTLLPNQILVEGSFDKGSYDAGQVWKLNVALKNLGKFTQNVAVVAKIPGMKYEKTIEIASPPEAARNDIALEGIVPEDAQVGVQKATLQPQISGAQEAIATFAVRSSDLIWNLDPSDFQAGGILHFTLRNQGGVPTMATGSVSLQDLSGNTLAQQPVSATIPQGKSVGISLAIPGGLKSGPYAIVAQAKDNLLQRTAVLNKPVTIQGQAASIEANLSQESLQAGENLSWEAILKNLGLGNLPNGVLKARVIRKGLSPPERWDVFDPAARVTGLAVDGDDVWLALSSSSSGYLIRYSQSKKKWNTFPLLPQDASAAASYVHTILPTENDVWFVSFRAGVTRYDKKRAQWENYLAGDKLSTNEIRQVVLDGDTVWFRGANSLDRLNLTSQTWRKFKVGGSNADLPYADFYDLALEKGEAWLATSAGVWRYDKQMDRWEAELLSERVLAVAIGPKDVWAGIDEHHKENGRHRARVGRYDRAKKSWSYFYNTHQEKGKEILGNSILPNTTIDHIAIDGDWVWFAGTTRAPHVEPIGTTGISRYNTQEDRWEGFADIPAYSHNSLNAWAIGSKYVAVATNMALAIFDKALGSWKVYLRDKGFEGPFYRMALAEQVDKLWLYYLGPETVEQLSTLDLKEELWTRTYIGLQGNVLHPIPDKDGDLWFWTEARFYDAAYNKGITHYDFKRDEWEHILASPDGMLDNKFWSIGIDGNDIWIGHGNGISRFKKKEGKWIGYYGPNRGGPDPKLPWDLYIISGIQTDPDAVWFFSGTTLYRYDKALDSWKRYTMPLPEAHFMAVGSDAVWIGSVYQNYVARLDKKTEEITQHVLDSRRNPDAPSFHRLDHIIATAQDAWFMAHGDWGPDRDVIVRNRSSGEWVKYFAKDIGPNNIFYRNIVQRAEEFLFAGVDGLMRLNEMSGKWSVLRAKQGELLDNNIFGIGLRGTEVWLGTAKGLNIWEPETNAWKTFPSDIKRAGLQAVDFVFWPDPAVVWTQMANGMQVRLHLVGDHSKPIWAKAFQVRIGEPEPLRQTIEGLFFAAGDYEMILELYNDQGQLLASQVKPFSVRKGGQLLSLAMDRQRYFAGQSAQVQMRVTNASAEEALGVPIGLFYGNEPLLSERQDFFPGETKDFIASCSAEKGKVLRAVAGDTVVERLLDVRTPALNAALKAPEFAGQEAFPVEVLLENAGDVELVLKVEISGIKNFGQLTLPAGQKMNLAADAKIATDTRLDVIVSGDVFQTLSRNVVYGVKLKGSLEIASKNSEGIVTGSLTLENIGLTAAASTARLQVKDKNGKVIADSARDVFLEKGQKFTDIFSVPLAAGDYRAVLSWLDGSTELPFGVPAKPPLAFTVQDKGFLAGHETLLATVINDRDEAATGTLRSTFAGITKEQAFVVPRKSTLAIEQIFSFGGLAPGEYPILLEVLEGVNSAAKWAGKLSVPKGQIMLVPPTGPITLPVGSPGKLLFQVINESSLPVSESLRIRAEGLLEDQRNVLVAPYQTTQQEFMFPIPEDFSQGAYLAQHSFQGKEETLPILIVGPKVDVTWSLDKPAYAPGQTAILTLKIKNLGQPWKMDARVRYKDFASSKTLDLSGEETLQFNIPLSTLDGEKIFCSINTSQGRSLYINRFDVPAKAGNVGVTLDKQDYDPGQTVTVQVIPEGPGKIRLESIGGFLVEENITGPKTYVFTLPSSLPQESFSVQYEFEEISGRVPFNVRGDSVKIVSGVLQRVTANTIRAEWKALANRALAGRLTVSLLGQDISAEVLSIDKDITLAQGENVLVEQFDYSGLDFGLGSVRAVIYLAGHEGPAAIFQSGLDEGAAVVLGVAAEKTIYAPGEAIRLKITSFGQKPTPMKLLSGSGNVLWDGMVEYKSVNQTTLEVGALQVGEHNLTIQLGDGANGAVNAVPLRIVVQSPPPPVSPVLPPVELLPPITAPGPVAPPTQSSPTLSATAVALVGTSTSTASQTAPSLSAGGTVQIMGSGDIVQDLSADQDGSAPSPTQALSKTALTKEGKSVSMAAKTKAPPKPSMKKATLKEPQALRIPPRISPTRQSWTKLVSSGSSSDASTAASTAGWSRGTVRRLAQMVFLGILTAGVGLVYYRGRLARRRIREKAYRLSRQGSVTSTRAVPPDRFAKK